MTRFLLISGSPRRGNTDFILRTIFESIREEKELILLRERNIKHCRGCLSCDKSNKCAIQDDMQELYGKLLKADVIIIGSPNYFDNVTGLLKDFIDRTNPFYETDLLKGKKLIAVVVGGGDTNNSRRVTDQALTYFADCHKLDFIGKYCFKALKPGEVEKDPDSY